jgi:polyisoprenoid-binding protein YceI
MTLRTCFFAAALAAVPAFANAWTLQSEMSAVSFGSIKNDYAGEAHSFRDISGSVSQSGAVEVNVALTSVDTNIEIRDERMIAQIFGDAAQASLSAQIDMAEMEQLGVGEAMITEVAVTLSLLGVETPFDASMFVMRLAEDKVMVASNAPVYLATEDLEIDAGVSALQEIAGLDSITRVTPLTARFVFEK